MIGESISIEVVRIERGKVRLAIDAPRDVPVFRSELLLRAGATPPPGGQAAGLAGDGGT